MEIQTLHQNIHWDPVSNPVQNFEMDDDDFESGNSTAKLYERSRIKALADEREAVQKKTFTKWVNSHLSLCKCQIEDLYMDLRDGKMLLKLLEILSGERLPKPTRGKMRIHCLENVDKAINFLTEQHVQFSNVGPHDIVDGNSRLTLGLIWTIILRFQIQDIMIDEYQSSETRSAKDALLLWCQMKTAGYNNVNVRNFTTSWRDGLAFNALIHKHRPDLVDYPKLQKNRQIENLEKAFNTAQESLGVAPILDSKDVNIEQPDEKSIITYVATLYHAFNNQKAQSVQSKRIGKVIDQAAESSQLVHDYERITSDLLEWISKTIELLKERSFANSLSGVQSQLAGFKTYRTVEKPVKFSEKGALEVLLFTIQSKMRANNQIPYMPADGKLIADINRAWELLEKEEHLRELALRDELIRQEKLEQLALRFYRKAGMREAWLSENQRLVAQENFGSDLAAVEAATKKHEAIETDIYAYEERVKAVVNVANDLEIENFHDIVAIKERQANVLTYWKNLIEVMALRRTKLNLSLEIQKVFQEYICIQDWIDEIKTRLKSPDVGRSLMEVEDLIQKHGLLEADIRMLENRKEKALESAQVFVNCEFPAEVKDYKPVDPETITKHGEELKNAYQELIALSEERMKILTDAKIMWEFLSQMEGEKEWIREKSQLMSNPDLGHDLSSVERLQRKHRALEEECQTRQTQIKAQINDGIKLINSGNKGAESIRSENDDVEKLCEKLIDLIAERKQRLKESQEFYQLMADCDDCDALLNEFDRVVKNEDVGTKLSVTQSLIKNNEETLQNIENVKETIHQLNATGAKVADYPESNANVLNVRLQKLNDNYKMVHDNAKKRENRLTNAIAKYKLFDESDTVRNWIVEKEKLISTLVPGEDLSELEVVKHRFDCFEKEMQNNATKVHTVNKLSESAVKVEHPDSGKIQYQQDSLNTTWNELNELVKNKKKAIDVAYRYNQYLTESTETGNWIQEKAKLIESTDELGNDLEGIMQLQRRLGGLQRDLQAIQAKLDHMDKEAENLSNEKPEAVAVIKDERKKLHKLWESLNEMLKERDDRLNDSSELQKFLLNLDHFQLWLKKMKTTIASEDVPQTLQETEKKIQDFDHLKTEIGAYGKDFNDLMNYGRKVTEGQTDAQYVFLSQRLNGMEEDWDTLQKMYDDRMILLKQAAEAQAFFRDANQVDVMFSKIENTLSKEDVPDFSPIQPVKVSAVQCGLPTQSGYNPSTLFKANKNSHEVAQELVRNFDIFISGYQEDRVNNVLNNGLTLPKNNFLFDKIQAKCDLIKKKREELEKKANERKEQLNNQLKLQELYQEIDDVEEWIAEKSLVAGEVPQKEKKSIAAMYSRFKAFEGELEANKDKLDHVVKQAEDIMKEHPHLSDQVRPRLENLQKQWNDLNQQTIEKSAKMADANRETLFDETAKSMMTWITEIHSQIVTTTEEVTEEIGLVEINEQMKEQNKKDQELATKRRLLQDMQMHAEKLKEQYPERREEFEQVHQEVRFKLTELEAPLTTKREKLLKQKRVRQFLRDVDDEQDWIGDKLAVVRDTNTMSAPSLLGAQQLQRRHKMLATEVENHEPRIVSVCKVGEEMIQEGHPQSLKFRAAIDALWADWDQLKKSVVNKQASLEKNEIAQKYLFDASEAEAWMGEQELFLMGEEKTKDEQSVSNATKKHEQMQDVIEKYGEEIRLLGERSRAMIDSNHPESEAVANKQARVDKMYAGLSDLCLEKKSRLEELTKLYNLLKEIMDLEAWIAERTQLASNHESGTDYEHNCVLRDRFAEFARETNELGKQRVAAANELCDALIDQGHAEAAEIAECKDRINESWADLLELIETRIQLLKTAWDLHKFLCECQDVLDRINEKKGFIPEDIGKDAKAVAGLQRKHAAFESQLDRLGKQVGEIKNQANILLPSYANERERLICDRCEEVLNAWRQLQASCEQRKSQLHNASDIHRFFAMYRKLRSWMNQMRAEMAAKERPRDVSGVELLMNNHRSLKAEIDAREENFSVCLSLGRTLINRRHSRMEEVRENCIDLVTERIHMFDEWTDRSETLQLMLEVYQFAREAAVAEAWLYAQEPYLNSQDLGESLDETLALLKKHLAFERAAATQEERFEALKKLTTLELKARERTPESEALRKREKQKKIVEAVKEFIPMQVPSTPISEASPSNITLSAAGGPGSSQTPAGTPKRGGMPGSQRPRDSIDGQAIPSDRFGTLVRKKEWESQNKKASNRSWHTVYSVLNKDLCTLSAYESEAIFKSHPQSYMKNEVPLNVSGCTAAPATDYTKRNFVFRLKLRNQGQILYQAESEQAMLAWVGAINGVSKQQSLTPKTQTRESAGGSVPPKVSRTQTLPSEQKDAGASKGGVSRFLTMSKKSKN